MSEDVPYKRMQVKVLYSFNNSASVFLSRSNGAYSIKVAQIPIATDSGTEMVTLGGYELKTCIQQVLKSSPETFQLDVQDYAVYYKDVTEQPDEPFVSNGVLSELLKSSKSNLIPGRVCQNVSASFLFGNKSDASSHTLEVRLKFHSIDREPMSDHDIPVKRPKVQEETKKMQRSDTVKDVMPVKATRTKSLPVFPYNANIYNIRTADKLNTPSRFDTKSVQDRFKAAPFAEASVFAKPKVVKKRKIQRPGNTGVSRQSSEPVRAMRTRSMITARNTPLMISSPIHEEGSSEDTDDTEYNDNHGQNDDAEDEDLNNDDALSPYTPQQPTAYKASSNAFHSLPDLEDLDSKRTHTIPSSKLPHNHGLVCTNHNCATTSSLTWRFFEIEFNPRYAEVHRATEFDKKNYEGMFGPLCNACYLFLRNKGFMRPEAVVKKYLKQQQYKREKEAEIERLQAEAKSLQVKRLVTMASSPRKFATPSHTPAEINQVIQNAKFSNNQDLNDFMHQLNSFGGPLTDIDPLPQDQIQENTPPMMATKCNTRVINIEENDDEDKENCPPVDASQFHSSSSPARSGADDFERMIVKSFSNGSARGSPLDADWMGQLFGGPTPKDQVTPHDETINSTNVRTNPQLPQMKTFSVRRSPRLNKKKAISSNMPSSPLMSKGNDDSMHSFFEDNDELEQLEDEINRLTKNNQLFEKQMLQSSPATRNDTSNSIMSLHKRGSSPHSDIYEPPSKQQHTEEADDREELIN